MPVSFYSEGKKNFVSVTGKTSSLTQINGEKRSFNIPVAPKVSKVISSPFLKEGDLNESSYLASLRKKRAKTIVSKELGGQ